jgi:hypothetical protein
MNEIMMAITQYEGIFVREHGKKGYSLSLVVNEIKNVSV